LGARGSKRGGVCGRAVGVEVEVSWMSITLKTTRELGGRRMAG